MRKIIFSNLRLRFLLYFVLLATAPLLLLGFVALSLLDTSHRQDVSALELQLIEQKIEVIEKFLADTLGTLEFRFNTLAGLSEAGAVAGETAADLVATEAQNSYEFLASLHEVNPAFTELYFLDRKGREQARYPALSANVSAQNWSGLAAFNAVVDEEANATYVSDVHYTLLGPSVTMAAPVRTLGGDIVRVLLAEVGLAELSRSIAGAVLGNTGGLVLVDARGRVVAHHLETITAGSYAAQARIASRVLAGEIVTGLKATDRYMSLFHSVPVVGAGKKIAQIGWALIAEWPLRDANAAINDVRNEVLLFTLLSIVVVLLLAPVVTNRLVYPINALKQGVVEIEQGHFDKKVSIHTHDELEELGGAFNRMGDGLKRLQELKNEFVYIAAHELRAPVTAIKGYISLIFEGDAGAMPTKKMGEFLEQVRRANNGLLQLVEDLLNVARSDAGKIEIQVRPVEIQSTAREVVDALAAVAAQKLIMVHYNDHEACAVRADADKLREVLMNFVSNAIKYTTGAGTVEIFHERQGDMLVTHVKDHGIGISPQAQKKLFEKFYRVKAAGTEQVTGTGLGLWITKQLVEKMGGDVRVVSEEGKGSIFSFSLPIAA